MTFKEQEQFTQRKKILRSNFYLLLLEIHDLPMFKQKEILEYKLAEWMKDKIQTLMRKTRKVFSFRAVIQ